jgi:hypothetical protein
MILDLERMEQARDNILASRDIGDTKMLMVLECALLGGEHDTVHFCETHESYESVCKKYLEPFKISDGISGVA